MRLREAGRKFAGGAFPPLSLEVHPGEVVALLGPRGAGKTTALRLAAGVMEPDQGSVRYLPPAETGYLPEQRGLFHGIPAERTLVYFGMLRGLSRAEARQRATSWLDRVGVSGRGGERLGDLPESTRRRLEIAAALMHRPAYVLLDEPFLDADPGTHDLLVELIGDLKHTGAAVLYTSSELHADERFTDRVVLLNRGRIILAGALDELRGRLYATGSRRLDDLLRKEIRDDDALPRPA